MDTHTWLTIYCLYIRLFMYDQKNQEAFHSDRLSRTYCNNTCKYGIVHFEFLGVVIKMFIK